MKTAFFTALALAFAFSAQGTEYWSGYDDSTGERVDIIVRFSERLNEGEYIFVCETARSTQYEATASTVTYSDPTHARVCANVAGMDRCFSVSR